MSMLWNCNLSKSSEITVGELLNLTCDGPTEGIDKNSLQLKDVQLSDDVPPLSLLQIKNFESTKAEFVVTSYRTGEHKSNEIVFYDGKNKVDVSGIEWKLNSVLKQDPTNPPQAFGSFPMWSISYPIWFWILLVAVLISVIGLPYLQYKKIRNRKKAFDDLKNLETALNPLDAFFKSARRMEKALEIGHVSPRGFVDQIDKDLRVYLSRSLQIPAHLWKINMILREIKSKHRKLYRDHGIEIKKYFSEFTKLKGEVQKKDGLYLMERAQKLTVAVDGDLSKKRGAR